MRSLVDQIPTRSTTPLWRGMTRKPFRVRIGPSNPPTNLYLDIGMPRHVSAIKNLRHEIASESLSENPTEAPREGTRPTGSRCLWPRLQARCPHRAGFQTGSESVPHPGFRCDHLERRLAGEGGCGLPESRGGRPFAGPAS